MACKSARNGIYAGFYIRNVPCGVSKMHFTLFVFNTFTFTPVLYMTRSTYLGRVATSRIFFNTIFGFYIEKHP